MKIKRLPPTLRDRKRYVAFAVDCDEALKRDEVAKLVWREATGFFGEKDMALMNIRVLDFDEDSQLGFLVCNHKAVGDVKAALALVNSTDGRKVLVVPIGVSGTLRALKKKFLSKRRAYEAAGGELGFLGGLRLVRRRGRCLDAEPLSQELAERVKNLNVRYIGLMENEVYLSQHK